MKKALKTLAVIVFSSALIVAVPLTAIFIFTYKEIDYSFDEMLFESSRDFNSTTFFAYDSDKDEYVSVGTTGSLTKITYSLDEISDYLKKGFVSVEDRFFYEHSGVDVKRTLRAAINYVTKREKIFGASTITQQLIKNISGDNDVSISRKLAEIFRARHIEKRYTKDEILELYLNVIPMSEGLFGVGAAARAYFGKEPSELSAAEAATLIGITNAPTAYNPYENPEKCRQKRDIILKVMYNDGIISDAEYAEAKSEPVNIIPRAEREGSVDSWFIETAISDVTREYASKNGINVSAARVILMSGGFSVYTTMDTSIQGLLEKYFENEGNFPEEIGRGLNFAMSIADAESGDLVAVVGRVGKKQANRLLNHASVPHTPGSTLKPIGLYAPLIDEGRINAATVFDDVPVDFVERDGEYREYPKNSPDIYDGLMCIKDALRLSKNTVAVRLCSLRSPRAVFDTLKNDYGFETLVEGETLSNGGKITDIAVSPMALGQLSRGVSLLKLTESYGVFSGDGKLRKMRSYTAVTDFRGNVVLENNKEEKQIMKPETARIMNTLLAEVVNNGTAGKITLSSIVETSGKTGTSGNNRDKTFIGYTPYYTAGIWCGYEGQNEGVVNISPDHLEIWDEIMTKIHQMRIGDSENIKSFSREGLVYRSFCKDSGELYSEEACGLDPRGSRLEYAYFTPNNCPDTLCHTHIVCFYDSVSKGVASEHCPRDWLVPVSLIRVTDRSFPKQVFVTDAEFVYRDASGYAMDMPKSDEPYFYAMIPEGEYVGKSKREKQFNSGCTGH